MNFYSFKIEYTWDILSLSPSHISQNIKHYKCFAPHSYPFRARLGTRLRLRSQKIWIFFLLKFNMVCMVWIVLMCWCQKYFLKNKRKNIIDMHFGTKSYLKSTRNHTAKHALRGTQLYTHGRITEFLFKYFFLQQNIYIYIYIISLFLF
jgi:hypothetical protein